MLCVAHSEILILYAPLPPSPYELYELLGVFFFFFFFFSFLLFFFVSFLSFWLVLEYIRLLLQFFPLLLFELFLSGAVPALVRNHYCLL